MYHYAGNNPIKYTDPDGRLYGLPREAQKKIQEHVITNSINYCDYNHIQQSKKGIDFPLLTQMVNGEAKYPVACKYMAAVNSFKMNGFSENKYFENISDFVENKRRNKALYIDVIKDIFGFDVIYHELSSGLTEDELKSLIGNKPAVLFFNQDKFWVNGNTTDTHGIAFSNDQYNEPYYGKVRNSIEGVRGSKSDVSVEDYVGGFYFEIKENE